MPPKKKGTEKKRSTGIVNPMEMNGLARDRAFSMESREDAIDKVGDEDCPPDVKVGFH